MDINDSSQQTTKQITPTHNVLKVYHKNIRSLRKKSDELIGHLHPTLPHIRCLTEHHLNRLEKSYVTIEGYTIGAQFCRVTYEKGGAIIYVHNSLQYTTIDLSDFCKEKDIEICAIKLILDSLNIFVITIYRAPAGNFNYFLQLENILQSHSTSISHIIICGDLNVNYLIETHEKANLIICYLLTI
jgi:exonuclease III